jgi:hypothetical protein
LCAFPNICHFEVLTSSLAIGKSVDFLTVHACKSRCHHVPRALTGPAGVQVRLHHTTILIAHLVVVGHSVGGGSRQVGVGGKSGGGGIGSRSGGIGGGGSVGGIGSRSSGIGSGGSVGSSGIRISSVSQRSGGGISSGSVVIGGHRGGKCGDLNGLLVDVGLSRDLNIYIRLSRDLDIHIRLSRNLFVFVRLSLNLDIDIGLSRDINVDIGLSGDLIVMVGLGQGIGVGVGHRRVVDTSCVEAGMGGNGCGQRLASICEATGVAVAQTGIAQTGIAKAGVASWGNDAGACRSNTGKSDDLQRFLNITVCNDVIKYTVC